MHPALVPLGLVSMLALALTGCDDASSPATESPSSPPPPQASVEGALSDAAPKPLSERSVEVPPDPDPEPEAPPEPELTKTDAWPFVEWDHAKAYVFNLDRGPGLSLFAYNASKGWNIRIHSEQDISKDQADQAVELTERTRGTFMVSKCPMPRHAVALFSGDTPVASINVCFECGDILVWPKWEPAGEGSEASGELRAKLQKAYDSAYPQWEAFFGTTLGLELDYTKIPKNLD